MKYIEQSENVLMDMMMTACGLMCTMCMCSGTGFSRMRFSSDIQRN